MTTAVALGLMLAFEPREPGIMMRPPRDPGQSILTGVLIERIILVSALMLAGAYGVFLWELDRTGRGPHDGGERVRYGGTVLLVQLSLAGAHHVPCRPVQQSLDLARRRRDDRAATPVDVQPRNEPAVPHDAG